MSVCSSLPTRTTTERQQVHTCMLRDYMVLAVQTFKAAMFVILFGFHHSTLKNPYVSPLHTVHASTVSLTVAALASSAAPSGWTPFVFASTSTGQSTLLHTLPRHLPTIRNLPLRTRSSHAYRSRLGVAYADSAPRTYTRGR